MVLKPTATPPAVFIGICLFGFFKELRPTATFLTDHMIADKNVTKSDTYSKIFPVETYSKAVMLVPVFILSDLLRYKPVMLTEAVAYLASYALLVTGMDLDHMEAVEAFLGWGTSARVAYQAYIYAVVPSSSFRKATSLAQTATLLGKCASYVVAQALVSTISVSYYVLDYITLAATALALLICCFMPLSQISLILLPTVRNNRAMSPIDNTMENGAPGSSSIESKEIQPEPTENYKTDDAFNRTISTDAPVLNTSPWPSWQHIASYFRGLTGKLYRAYSDPVILKWSIWTALAVCGFQQIVRTIQNLWQVLYYDNFYEEDVSNRRVLMNGIVSAAGTLMMAILAYLVQFLHLNFEIIGELILSLCAAASCVLLLFMAETSSQAFAYIGFVLVGLLYQLPFVVSSNVVASRLKDGSYALIIGCNTWIALLLQSLLAFIVTDAKGPLRLAERQQYLVYGSLYGAVASLFAITALQTMWSFGFRNIPGNLMKKPAAHPNSEPPAELIEDLCLAPPMAAVATLSSSRPSLVPLQQEQEVEEIVAPKEDTTRTYHC